MHVYLYLYSDKVNINMHRLMLDTILFNINGEYHSTRNKNQKN